MPLKCDSEAILAHMRGLAASLRLDGNRNWWPNWLFRSDHVENAANILNDGRLLSRFQAEDAGVIIKDSGSPYHVRQLDDQHRRYVRLYFRPRTPTQYANEGFRPANEIQYDAHMPVPVYLLFSSSLLAEEGVCFSKGRLMWSTEIGGSFDFLRGMNFANIYHDGPVGRLGESAHRSEILNARHSETLIGEKLSLGFLRHIVCRSAPERETLVNLLNPTAKDIWMKKVHVDEGHRRLFLKRGTFVQGVELGEEDCYITFYPNFEQKVRGQFYLRLELTSPTISRKYENQNFTVNTRKVRAKYPGPLSMYTVRIFLNDDLAYIGKYDRTEATKTIF